jgi:hypothetical protein
MAETELAGGVHAVGADSQWRPLLVCILHGPESKGHCRKERGELHSQDSQSGQDTKGFRKQRELCASR